MALDRNKDLKLKAVKAEEKRSKTTVLTKEEISAAKSTFNSSVSIEVDEKDYFESFGAIILYRDTWFTRPLNSNFDVKDAVCFNVLLNRAEEKYRELTDEYTYEYYNRLYVPLMDYKDSAFRCLGYLMRANALPSKDPTRLVNRHYADLVYKDICGLTPEEVNLPGCNDSKNVVKKVFDYKEHFSIDRYIK